MLSGRGSTAAAICQAAGCSAAGAVAAGALAAGALGVCAVAEAAASIPRPIVSTMRMVASLLEDEPPHPEWGLGRTEDQPIFARGGGELRIERLSHLDHLPGGA